MMMLISLHHNWKLKIVLFCGWMSLNFDAYNLDAYNLDVYNLDAYTRLTLPFFAEKGTYKE